MKVLIFGAGGISDGIFKALPGVVNVVDKDNCNVIEGRDVARALNRYEPDTVIVCAGVSHVSSIRKSSPVEWLEELHTNLYGSYTVAKNASLRGIKNMIFIASVAGLYGKPDHSGYSASKAGVISLVQSLAFEGYNAYAISPGRVNTKMREHDYPGEDTRTRLDTSEIGELVKQIIDGKYTPGDNIIIRRIGHETQPIMIDDGEPWKTDLKIGQPPAV
jgi:NAD(P)-dependent dehydrogenase (short-subunit alcohol dehydrogenase family)